MSLFDRAIAPPPTVSDDAIERYLAALAHGTSSRIRSSGAGFARTPSIGSWPRAKGSTARACRHRGGAEWGGWVERACTRASPSA